MQTKRVLVRRLPALAALIALASASGPAWAAKPNEPSTNLDHKAFFKQELRISTSHVRVGDALTQLTNRGAWETFLLQRGDDPRNPKLKAWIDPRSGAATNVMEAFPLLPGNGAGNQVTLAQLARTLSRAVPTVDEGAVAGAVRRFVEKHRDVVAIDVQQLGDPRVTQINPQLWQVSIPQHYRGIPVRDARLAATISHGNLILVGTEVWGDVQLESTVPKLAAEAALEAGFAYAEGRAPEDVILRAPTLEILPIAPPEFEDGEKFAGPTGAGYRHKLVWTFEFQRQPEHARWELIVDAETAEVMALQDKNLYENHQIKGAVYPVTSTGICPTPGTCGTMQGGWPMPFADTALASPNNFTNSAGIFDYTGGNVTTTLTGRYVDIVDSCGAVNETSAVGTLDLGGVNNQHDCTTGRTSAGDTPAARTAFYEVNKLAEMGRGWLPTNTWLQNRLTTNVNINQTCNGFWNGVSINFYRSGGGCRNTGELAGVFDHEWGHGLDDNDAAGALSNSSEGYADIAAIYRLQTSCVGHGFFQTLNDGCGMTADGTGFNSNEAQQGAAHCDLDCSGVRDADYLKHSPNTPDTALGYVCTSCLTGTGPCGRQVHCAAAPTRQAAWDFAARDLQQAPFSLDSQSAFILANRIFYQGSGNVGAWHACTCGSSSSGCGATNGYMQWLAADDDNGNLNDGTPHMTALFNAFNRHGIACATPTPQNGGCASGPTAAPGLGATAGNYSVALSWNAISGATRYWVFRSEGHAGCNFGKTKIAETTGLAYTDTQVANGRTYYYNVVAAGASSACTGRASNCVSATPTAPTNPDFTLTCNPSSLTVTQGANTTSTCTVSALNGFTGTVALSCSGLASGLSCGFNPASVSGSGSSTLTLSAGSSAPTGSSSFSVAGTSGALSHSAGMSVTVNPAGGGGGGQTAVFDAARQAPACNTVGNSCDSGASLLLGRDGRGPEPNQPNTINDSCADGTSGTFHSDESNDRLKVSTIDGTNFAPGKTVRIDATVWAWTTPSADKLDLYYTANAASPSWTFIATLTPTVAGSQTLAATYTLPSGALQAVRARFRYQGAAASCGTGAYDDHDDLVFAVNSPAATTVFFDNFESDLGWTRNASGTDTATSGLWERGDPAATTSSGAKQLGTTVSGVNDLVTGRLAGSSAGVHDIDAGVTTIRSPAITLPSTGTLTLSFSYYLAHGSNSSSADFFRVSIVGATTSTAFQSLGAASNRNGVWTAASANISAFAGQTVRILIAAADASTASLVEAGVDDVRVTQQ